MTMKKVNIHDAKARLSEYLDLVAQGERVLICRRNHPVAELRPVGAVRTEPRPLGGAAIELPGAFFDPLPEDVAAAFYAEHVPGASTAAEAPPTARWPTRPQRKRTRNR